jgi:hypothetical protein
VQSLSFGLFHLAYGHLGTFMLSQMTEVSSFFRLNNIPLHIDNIYTYIICIYIAFPLSFYPMIDAYIDFMPWLLEKRP